MVDPNKQVPTSYNNRNIKPNYVQNNLNVNPNTGKLYIPVNMGVAPIVSGQNNNNPYPHNMMMNHNQGKKFPPNNPNFNTNFNNNFNSNFRNHQQNFQNQNQSLNNMIPQNLSLNNMIPQNQGAFGKKKPNKSNDDPSLVDEAAAQIYEIIENNYPE